HGLLFGTFCIFTSIHIILFENKIVFLFFSSIPWEIYFRLIYIITYFAGIFFVLFIKSLYPRDMSDILINLFTKVNLLFIISVIILPVYYFTYTLPLFGLLFILMLFYIMYIYIRALYKNRTSSLIGSFGFLFLGMTLINDLLHINLIINTTYLMQFGLVIFIFTHSYILSTRYSRAYVHVFNIFHKMKKNNRALISLKNNLEEIVRERTNELQNAKTRIETVGKMTSEIVHDLKNPISAIIGFSELANEDDIGKSNRSEYLEIIQKEANRLSNMSQEILDFVKGGSSLQKEVINLKLFLLEFYHTFGMEFKKYKINFELNIDEDIDVLIDTEKIRRVLINLSKNSIEAFENYKKENKLIKLKVYKSKKAILIKYSDNGPGIPKEIQEHLFVPFVTFNKENGTGLGMSLAKEIIESHKGRLYFDANVKEGAEFIIELPNIEGELN
ncbi:MAG: sensor histidine kinase, partial [Leptospiraceae bacterium]|nr:sensor histidine kinase [Leptospiraceae bacterium]